MNNSITVTRQYGPFSRRTNIAGSNFVAHAVVTMEAFLKIGLANYDVSAFVVSYFSSVYPSML